jgi:hypothetical protein
MRTKLLVGLVASLLILISIALFVVAASSWTLSETASAVHTSSGVIDLPAGTLLGGDFDNYFILEETRVFETSEGPQEIGEGTFINCFAEPYMPDACMGY